MITVTKAAQQKILENLKRRGRGKGITVGVRTTGCSGMAYTLEYLDEYVQKENVLDTLFPEFVVRIEGQHIPYLDGLEIDYVRKGLNEGFEFINPIEKDRCGCGESFRV